VSRHRDPPQPREDPGHRCTCSLQAPRTRSSFPPLPGGVALKVATYGHLPCLSLSAHLWPSSQAELGAGGRGQGVTTSAQGFRHVSHPPFLENGTEEVSTEEAVLMSS
jgi:hypothetical protein